MSREGDRASDSAPPSYGELFTTFLRISLLGFGGPNAHLALMLDEIVERKKWIDREHFLHLIGITNLLPGPNSSEVTIHIGYTQRGWAGGLVTGGAFLAPTFCFVLFLSWLYFRFGALPAVEPLFWGLKPAIVAIILWAGWRLGREAVDGIGLLTLAAFGVAVTLLAGRWAVAAMVLGGLTTWWAYRRKGPDSEELAGSGMGASKGGPERSTPGDHREEGDSEDRGGMRSAMPFIPVVASGSLFQAAAGGAAGAGGLLGAGGLGGVLQVFGLHLGLGSVLFGGGYVLVALLEPYAVDAFGWLTQAQFLDGVALTQAVPGPISTLAAFVGFAAAGPVGAVLGTAGIYIPAFVAVFVVAPHLERLRRLDPVRATLAGVNAVVAGAILGVGLTLVPAAVAGWATGALLLGALVAHGVFRVPAPWIVLGGLVAGGLRLFFG